MLDTLLFKASLTKNKFKEMKKIIFSLLLSLSVYSSNAILRVTLALNAEWVSFYKDCHPAYWYCWEITSQGNTSIHNYIDMNTETQTITFVIDNTVNTAYNNQFISGNTFNFIQDTYLKPEIAFACTGISKVVRVPKGIYSFTINEGIITINAPFTFVD